MRNNRKACQSSLHLLLGCRLFVFSIQLLLASCVLVHTPQAGMLAKTAVAQCAGELEDAAAESQAAAHELAEQAHLLKGLLAATAEPAAGAGDAMEQPPSPAPPPVAEQPTLASLWRFTGMAPESSSSSSSSSSGDPTGIVLGTQWERPQHEVVVLPELLPAGHSFATCLANAGLSRDYASVSRELSRVRNAKGKLAEPLRNYTCGDVSVGTAAVPEDDVTFTWVAPVADDYAGSYDAATGTTSATPSGTAPGAGASSGNGGGDGSALVSAEARGGRARSVRQLLSRNNAQVLLIDDFVTDHECDHMIEAATPGLQRSTVNEEGNNQAVSQYRNSQVRRYAHPFLKPQEASRCDVVFDRMRVLQSLQSSQVYSSIPCTSV